MQTGSATPQRQAQTLSSASASTCSLAHEFPAFFRFWFEVLLCYKFAHVAIQKRMKYRTDCDTRGIIKQFSHHREAGFTTGLPGEMWNLFSVESIFEAFCRWDHWHWCRSATHSKLKFITLQIWPLRSRRNHTWAQAWQACRTPIDKILPWNPKVGTCYSHVANRPHSFGARSHCYTRGANVCPMMGERLWRWLNIGHTFGSCVDVLRGEMCCCCKQMQLHYEFLRTHHSQMLCQFL